MTTKEAMDHLTNEIETDQGYRIGWQANIAMAFFDEASRHGICDNKQLLHSVANKAADNFLKLLCYRPSAEVRDE